MSRKFWELGQAFGKRPENPIKEFYKSRDRSERSLIMMALSRAGLSSSFQEVLHGAVGRCPRGVARILQEFGYPGDAVWGYRAYVVERSFQDFVILAEALAPERRVVLYLYVAYQAELRELMKDLHLGVRGAQSAVRNLRKFGLVRKSRGARKRVKYRLATDFLFRIKEALRYLPSLREDIRLMMEVRKALGKPFRPVLPEESELYAPLEGFSEEKRMQERVPEEENPLARFFLAQSSEERRAILEDVREARGTKAELEAVIAGRAGYCPRRIAKALEGHGYPGDAAEDYRAFKVKSLIEKLSSGRAGDRLRVIAYLFAAYSATCKELAEDLGFDFERLKALVYRMRDEGIVRKLSAKKEYVHWRLTTDFRVEFAECVKRGQFLDEVFGAMEVRKAKGKPCLELFP